LSRRLGDDPLSRAKSQRAKAVEGQAPAALDSGGQQSAAQVGIQAASRASYNDVFFQRRGDGVSAPQTAADGAHEAPEVPEISEISQIPEIREAAAASASQASFDATADVKTVSEVAKDAHVPAPSVLIADEVVAKPDAPVSATGPALEAKTDPESPPASSQAPAKSGDDSKPESPKSGGFFKRLFGKFK
jgi:hypothetical protein